MTKTFGGGGVPKDLPCLNRVNSIFPYVNITMNCEFQGRNFSYEAIFDHFPEINFILLKQCCFVSQSGQTQSVFGCPASQSRVNLHQFTFTMSNCNQRPLSRRKHSLAATVLCSDSLKDQQLKIHSILPKESQ